MDDHPFPEIHAKVPDRAAGETCLLWCEETGDALVTWPSDRSGPRATTAAWNRLPVRSFFALVVKYGISGAVKAWEESPQEIAWVAAWMDGHTVSG
jgi:hypothetical protein